MNMPVNVAVFHVLFSHTVENLLSATDLIEAAHIAEPSACL